jgi:hypothetical protein
MHKLINRARLTRCANGVCRSAFIALLTLGASVGPGGVSIAAAQTAAPVIVASAELQIVPGIDTPWTISIDSKGAIPAQTILLVRGLTPQMRLSEGRAFGTGVWVVPLASIANLKISIPADAIKGALLDLSLATLDGTALAQRRVKAVIVNFDSLTSTPTVASIPSAPRELSPKEREAALKLVEMGNSELKLGNPLTARQFYQRATDRGLPQAAMALGATYDPAELPQIEGLVTVRPDVKLARKWYEKALELGDPSAAARIRRLSQP